MADCIATFAIDKLLKFIDAQSKLQGSFPGEIQSITNELNTIKSVLKDAEKKAEDNDLINEWLSQVRQISYRIEDAIDEYLMLQHKKEASSNLFSKSARSILQLRPKHKLISTIREIINEIRDIDSTRQRYEFITTEGVNQEHQGWQTLRDLSAFVEDSELVGVDRPKKAVFNMLRERKGCSPMVAVVGMGGLGKTTLVGKVYKEAKRYFELHAWVTVSQSYNIFDILKSIFKQFLEAAHYNDELQKIGSITDLISVVTQLRNFLEHNKKIRHIVVLDDVWDSKDMHIQLCSSIKSTLHFDSSENIILMTTRDQNVAHSWAAEIPIGVYNLEPLPSEEAWNLFCNKAFGKMQCPVELEMLSRDIVEKCSGLPLAIVTVGRLLSTKPKVVSEWRKLHNSLGFELQRNSNLMSILLLSYLELPCNLKACFLYLGMFPEDVSVNCNRLARLWIAEGFVECNERRIRPEDVAEGHLTTLIQRNLVQVSRIDQRGRIREITVHDILHNMILSQLKKSGFSLVLSENKAVGYGYQHFRRLSSHGSIDTIKDLQSSSFKSNIHSILISGREKLVFDMISGFGKKFVRHLRILDLQDSKIYEVPKELGDLHYLQYLSLRNTKVRKLPKTIGQLCNLQTLDLKQTPVSELPKEVKHLHKLRYLLAYFYDGSITNPLTSSLQIPKGVLENLKELQKLAFLNVCTGCQVIELGSLKQLTRLGIIDLRKEDGVAFCQAIQEMKYLQTLSTMAASQTGLMDIQVLESPPLYLETLSLTGRLEKLPKWIAKLNSLKRVFLRNSRLNEDPLSLLQCLPNLVYLYLENAYDGETLDFGINGFSKLETLHLYQLRNLKSIKGSLPLIHDAEIIVYQKQHIDLPPHIKFESQIIQYDGMQCRLLYL